MRENISEFLCTYILVFCGTGAIIINQETNGSVTHVGICITFGLIVMGLIYGFGQISGAHMNPAVSIAFAFLKILPIKKLPFYIISQILGGLAASTTLKLLFPKNSGLGGTIPSGTDGQSFVLEFILTFILMLVILTVALGNKEHATFAGIAIGGVVLLEAMFAGPISGASMNPIRSLAPALVSGNLNSQWLYIVAPIAATILASITWKTILKEKNL
ncbi:Aquaporin Z 2 [Flavobacterium sp. CECT 9288]|uniref:aquaporin n=1 Tax=Flavobacterium sp. CECT 9288 TaxID=2845819 RepID=UPI001E5AA14C|nr:aquaporin [Flavobacterium sp. CECT 9288]CAH0334928.1 Aquaporin Z 2 [Flavobacterium sp. CECT 9288]